jgi:hypothetical protein
LHNVREAFASRADRTKFVELAVIIDMGLRVESKHSGGVVALEIWVDAARQIYCREKWRWIHNLEVL